MSKQTMIHGLGARLIWIVLRKKHNVPAASLQMLWGKIYVVYDAKLAQELPRSRVPTVDGFILDFSKKVFGTTQATFNKIKTAATRGLIPSVLEATHTNMNAAATHKMNTTALEYLSRSFSGIKAGDGGALEHANMYLWFRDVITMATSKACFGEDHPLTKDNSLHQALWWVQPLLKKPTRLMFIMC